MLGLTNGSDFLKREQNAWGGSFKTRSTLSKRNRKFGKHKGNKFSLHHINFQHAPNLLFKMTKISLQNDENNLK